MAEDTSAQSNSFFDKDSGLYSDGKSLVSFLQSSMMNLAKEYRKRFDLRWYVYNSYYDGNAWIMYNRITNRIENIPLEEWRDKMSVPDIFVNHRSIKAIILNKNPVYDVVPTANDSYFDINAGARDPATGLHLGEAKDGPKIKAAKVAGKILGYLDQKLDLKKKRDDALDDALIMGNGYWKIDFDQSADDGRGDCRVTRISPFSLYLDPATTDATTWEGCRYIVYVTPRDVKYVELMYGKTVAPDNKMSSSQYEIMYKQYKFRNDESAREFDTVLVYEFWVREPYKEKLPNGETIVKYKMRCITTTKDTLLRDVYDPIGDNDYPFVSLQINNKPGDPYADGNVKFQKELVDQVNRRYSQAAESATKMTNPRILAPQGSIKPGSWTNAPGSITEYNPSFQPPTPIQGVGVAQDVFRLIDMSKSYIQDASGVHDVSRGVLPPGISSGRQLELAQAADTMVLGPYIRALEDFLKRSAKKILKVVKEKYPSERTVAIRGKQGATEEVSIIPEDIDFSDVNVEIGSFLANTKAARQDMLIQLLQSGAIDPQTLLEYFEFPDTQSIIDRLHKQRDLMADITAKRAATQPPQGQEPVQGARQVAPREMPAFR